MHIIRDAATIAATCDRTPDFELRSLLCRYAATFEEFGDGLDATIIIIECADTLRLVEQAYGARLVAEGQFTFPVETIARHGAWYDVLWVQSDDGSGLVLLAEGGANSDTQLVTACKAALDQAAP